MPGLNLISAQPTPPSDGPPQLFDRTLLRTRKNRASREFIANDFLFARAASDLIERIETVNRNFETCLVIGGGGAIGRALKDNPKAAGKITNLIEADISPSMAKLGQSNTVCLDEEYLPIKETSIDLILSCLSLHWTNDIIGALIQFNYALKPDGFFAGAIFGGSTLTELNQILKSLDSETPQFRISPFADTIDMAGLLGRAGFAMPVSDIDRVNVRYSNAFYLMNDLKYMGETNILTERSRKPVSKSFFIAVAEQYKKRFVQADGKIPARFDIIHFSGWGPHPDQPKPKRPGSAKARLADALGVDEIKVKT